MQIITFQNITQITPLLERPSGDFADFRTQVAPILAAVRQEGDAAVRRFTKQFEGYTPQTMQITRMQQEAAVHQLTPALKNAIEQAYHNIKQFHALQKETPFETETMPGVLCGRKSLPIERVGLYIPGGTAPLFSTVLMLGIPAQLAGCAQVVLCTPCNKAGEVHPAVLFAAQLCGIDQIFGIGGAQAIAAMAYGTESVPKVWKIFGPGNPWVTAAKQLVFLDGTAIDMPAGPSEVAVVADASANPSFVAADLLSQAEHGTDSQVVLICTDKDLIDRVLASVEAQVQQLPRQDIARGALANSKVIWVKNMQDAMLVSNIYAPEHLILQVEQPEDYATLITNAGSVFLGHFTPESAGDYASGTNHTLPTNGFARAYAGVSLDSFMKKITFQKITEVGLQNIGSTIMEMAEAEGLMAHSRAVSIRLNTSKMSHTVKFGID
jgi:histidinol dehydrogenase